jgi:Leucine-rich repeat (LRR) protein
MRFIRRLHLSDNEIEDIGTSAFTNIGRVGTIGLARNRLTELNFRTFNELKYLEEIDFAENRITRLSKSTFIDLNNVFINASFNGIEEIEDGTFQVSVQARS